MGIDRSERQRDRDSEREREKYFSLSQHSIRLRRVLC